MNNQGNNGGAGGQDYLDKAFNMGAKKFGGAQGQKIAGNRGMSEKIVCFYPPFPLLSWPPIIRRGDEEWYEDMC
jgi:hypothetical protein